MLKHGYERGSARERQREIINIQVFSMVISFSTKYISKVPIQTENIFFKFFQEMETLAKFLTLR